MSFLAIPNNALQRGAGAAPVPARLSFSVSGQRVRRMSTHVALEWKFSPPNYFEEPIEIPCQDYTMIIADGQVRARPRTDKCSNKRVPADPKTAAHMAG